jgi:hypothetical protein
MIKNSWRGPVRGLIVIVLIIGSAFYLWNWAILENIAKAAPASLITLVPAWVLMLAAPFILFVITLIYFVYSTREIDIREPDFVAYTQDILIDIHWSWRWLPPTLHGNLYTLVNLTPYCPSCSVLLAINNHNNPLVICANDRCNWQWDKQLQHDLRICTAADLDAKVRTEIGRKTHTL